MDRARITVSAALVVTALIVLMVTATLALTACGGSGQATNTARPASASSAVVSSTETTSGSPSPVATPTTPAQVAAAYAAALDKFRSPIALFAKHAHLEDRSIGVVRDGVKAIRDYWDEWPAALAITSRSHFAGSAGAIVEEKGEAGGTAAYAVNVLRVRGSKITAWYVYYSDWLSDRIPKFAPALLTTPPGSSDTETVSRAVAGAYMSALQALVPTRLAPLYTHEVVYQDTSRDMRYAGPPAAVAEHAKMFALKGLRFQANGIVCGPGWAAVMWKRSDHEGGKPPDGFPGELAKWAKRPTIHGVSILEIRDGRIARETIYSDHLRTRY